eukprot:GGOE01015442.1.p1 GENE.GGOE01015442.1~~GGOE01015442.1.p1  ORF type:complete len:552 (+),score=73.52 GGOE01015442.1:95-1657(+)
MWTKVLQDAGCSAGARRAHTTCVVEHWMLLFGGRSKNQESISDLLILDLLSMVWQTQSIHGIPPSSRWNHSASAIGNQMYIFGGDNSALLNDLHAFNTDSMSWSEPSFSGMAPSPRYAHSAIVFQHSIVIFGGSSTELLNDVHVFNADTLSFTQPVCSGPRPVGRCGHAAACVDHWMVIFGGLAASFLGDLWLLDLDSFMWFEVDVAAGPRAIGICPSPRSHHSATAINNFIFFFGGWNGSMKEPHVMNEMHVLEVQQDPLQVQWHAQHLQGNPPTPRNTHSAFLFQSKLFVFGGWDRKAYFSDFHECELGALLQHFALQRLCLAWNPGMNPTDALNDVVTTVKKFIISRSALLQEGLFSDVVFRVQGQEICAHKCILANQSEYFRSAFSSGMQEAAASVLDVGCAGGQMPSYDAFHAFLSFLYTGQPKAEIRYLNELIGVADYYHEVELQEWAEEQFRKSVSAENAVDLLLEANRLHQEGLMQFCIDFVRHHKEEIDIRNAPDELEEMMEQPQRCSSKD